MSLVEKRIGIMPLGQYSANQWQELLAYLFHDAWTPVCIDLPSSPKKQKDIPDVDFLIFDGGSDVLPSLYGRFIEPGTSFNERRDLIEMFYFKYYYYSPTKYVGICRGHQFINVMLNGLLIQDMKTHGLNHSGPTHCCDVINNTALRKYVGEVVLVTNSLHHQAVGIIGETLRATLVGPAGVNEGTESIHDDKIRTVQSHPDMMLFSMPLTKKTFPKSAEVMHYLFRVR